MMTRKDYQKFAAMIKNELQCLEEFRHNAQDNFDISSENQADIRISQTCGLASDLANILAADNPLFDYNRFMLACGIEPKE